MAGTITVSGVSAGDPAGTRLIGPMNIVGTVAVGETWAGTLASGDNTIPVPAGAVACVISNPTATTGTIKLRTNTNSTDGGLVLPSGNPVPTVYAFPATAPTSIILNSSVAQTGTLTTVLFV